MARGWCLVARGCCLVALQLYLDSFTPLSCSLDVTIPSISQLQTLCTCDIISGNTFSRFWPQQRIANRVLLQVLFGYYSGYLFRTTMLFILSIYMGLVARQVDHHQAIHSILCCAYNYSYICDFNIAICRVDYPFRMTKSIFPS
jgi:hypothetical protein